MPDAIREIEEGLFFLSLIVQENGFFFFSSRRRCPVLNSDILVNLDVVSIIRLRLVDIFRFFFIRLFRVDLKSAAADSTSTSLDRD